VSALSVIMATLDPRAAGVCLGFQVPPAAVGMAPDTQLVQRLSSIRTVVPLEDCPRTYSRMIAEVDAEGRVVDRSPPGYVDPYRVAVTEQRYFLPDSAVFAMRVEQGAGDRHYACRAYHRGEWGSTCVRESVWVH
jgi:hypothetical protein